MWLFPALFWLTTFFPVPDSLQLNSTLVLALSKLLTFGAELLVQTYP
jgi:hypothetical protein